MKRRVLLKLSGEALAGEKHTGFDEPTVTKVAKQVKTLVDQGIEVGIVIGGGNFWRGRSSENIDRTKADQIGMLATIMNDAASLWLRAPDSKSRYRASTRSTRVSPSPPQ